MRRYRHWNKTKLLNVNVIEIEIILKNSLLSLLCRKTDIYTPQRHSVVQNSVKKNGSNSGLTLAWLWSNSGLTLAWLWSNFGLSLVYLWSTFGLPDSGLTFVQASELQVVVVIKIPQF